MDARECGLARAMNIKRRARGLDARVSSLRSRALTAIFTSPSRRASSREPKASPITRLERRIAASTVERRLSPDVFRRFMLMSVDRTKRRPRARPARVPRGVCTSSVESSSVGRATATSPRLHPSFGRTIVLTRRGARSSAGQGDAKPLAFVVTEETSLNHGVRP